jgi:hypothetical protein
MQLKKLQNDPTFALGLILGNDIITQNSGYVRDTWFIRADLVSGWLYQINPNKVREDRRHGLMMYREACTKVLNDYITGSVTAPPSPNLRIVPYQPAPLAEQSVALVRIETKVDTLHDKVQNIEQRLDRITVMHEIVVCTGFVYVAVFSSLLPFRVQDADEMIARNYVLIAIGETTKPAQKRVQEYVGKLPIEPPKLMKVIATDDHKQAEQVLHTRRPLDVRQARPAAGASQSNFRDLFWARLDHIELLAQLPNQVTVKVLQDRLFEWCLKEPQPVPLRLWEDAV